MSAIAEHPGPERRGVSTKRVIDVAKESVSTLELAERLCVPDGLRRVGDRRVAQCPLPDHLDKTPSFTVYIESNSWYCFGACSRGGDVVDLAAAAWGYGEGEMAMAAADLLREFGHEIPARPASWYRRQERQKPVREAIEEARIRHLRRRIFQVYFRPLVEGVADLADKKACEDDLWALTPYPAMRLYEGMMRR